LTTFLSVIVLDELDHIAHSTSTLSSLFACMRVVGIANTHTLTASVSAVNGSTGVQTLHFSAYSATQLAEIVQMRLAPLSDDITDAAAVKRMLPVPALTLLSKKIATQTGDVRAIFEVLRGAIDLAVVDAKQAGKDASPIITPTHVLAALKAHAPATAGVTAAVSTQATAVPSTTPGNSELVTKARALSMHARLAMLAVVLASQRLDAGLAVGSSPTSSVKSPIKRMLSSPAVIASAALDSAQLHGYYTSLLTRSDSDAFVPVSRSEFTDLLGILETVGLVSMSLGATASPVKRSSSFGGTGKGKMAGTGTRSQEIRLAEGVRVDELLRGLGVLTTEDAQDIREEEVRAVYEREHNRIAREIKNRATQSSASIFAEAIED
jgi:cell division control protein 6